MHRRVEYDPRSKRWEASLYALGDRPSDGKLVPILTPIKPAIGVTISTEGQVSRRECVDASRVKSARILAMTLVECSDPKGMREQGSYQ